MASLCATAFPAHSFVAAASASAPALAPAASASAPAPAASALASPPFWSLASHRAFHRPPLPRVVPSPSPPPAPPSRRNSPCPPASAFRKRHNDRLPPGAHEMVDEETGETVLYFGLEDDDRLPSDDQLQWEPVKHVRPGDTSEDAWYRILKSSPSPGKKTSLPDDILRSSTNMNYNKLSKKNKSYPDSGSVVPSKGLFSKLKVQPLRSKSNMSSGKLDQTVSRQSEKTSDELWDSEDEQEERIGRSRYVSKSERDDGGAPEEERISRSRNFSKYQRDYDGAPKERIGRSRSVSQYQRDDGGAPWVKTPHHQSSEFRKEDIAVSGATIQRSSQNRKNTRSGSFKEVVADDFFSIRTFKDIGANDLIINSINSMGVTRPSQIQAMAYKHIMEGRSCILADQTGSGKTLAYLTPLYQRLLLEEAEGLNKSLPKKPRCLVILPTSELAAQVLNVCRSFSRGGAALKSMVATGGFKLRTQIEALVDSPDIVIATPGRFLQLLDSGNLELDNLKSVILDEVDVLFDDPEFSDTLEKIENSTPVKTQYIHVTATLPVDVCDAILENHPTSIPLMGPGLHCTATGLQEVLVDCSGEGEKTPESAYENKKKALLQLVEQQPVSKTILFCNKIETCRKVENTLKRIDRKGSRLSVLPYHAALSLEARMENMQQFIKSDSSHLSKFLVCTDRASRGLDMVDVEHVILFDFPRDPSEYVRRVGRTARAGGVGKAFVFVVGKQVSLARKIMVKNEKGHPIHTVPEHSF